MVLPVTTTQEGEAMFGGLAAGFAHLVKPSENAKGVAKDKQRKKHKH